MAIIQPEFDCFTSSAKMSFVHHVDKTAHAFGRISVQNIYAVVKNLFHRGTIWL